MPGLSKRGPNAEPAISTLPLTNPSTRTALDCLPVEILGQITALLDNTELVTLAASSRSLNSFAEARLYDHVDLGLRRRRRRTYVPSDLPDRTDEE
jgi:hypothetical protein